MTARLYSVGATRLLARLCKERSDAAWKAVERHHAAAFATKVPHERKVRLEFEEAARCTAAHWKKIANYYDRAAEDLEHAQEGLP